MGTKDEEMAWLKALAVDCPVCRAKRSFCCKNISGLGANYYEMDKPHQSRIEAAQRYFDTPLEPLPNN